MNDAVRLVSRVQLDPQFPLSKRELREVCAMLLDVLGLEGRTFSLTLVDDREIAGVNATFLGCTGPTNILSFPDSDGEAMMSGMDDEDSLGELMLSVDTLARETFLYGQQPLEHLARLLAHGLLHLAGFDHGEAMFDLTDGAVDMILLQYGTNDIGE
ncbi:rRNA maturation RNase YbeY [Pseudodesulfovibrio sp. JC047]|uniref:rRNA maturation RNase YbeY n=1 Tax=Pseudodesulfovibrio sp. JC047 TaxID=2683199 RepID=UPI0013CF7153|nr:rRNA maturation RNase YbeY [Pseudodesulfovibrio sp. JC047]NDV19352.1 rRNA maturation RNase YbeY [Pseudodesulfovibrio sp. JC047]